MRGLSINQSINQEFSESPNGNLVTSCHIIVRNKTICWVLDRGREDMSIMPDDISEWIDVKLPYLATDYLTTQQGTTGSFS